MGTTGGCIYSEETIFKGWLDNERGNYPMGENFMPLFC